MDLIKILFKEKFIVLHIFTNRDTENKHPPQKPEKEQDKPEECKSKELIGIKIDINELML